MRSRTERTGLAVIAVALLAAAAAAWWSRDAWLPHAGPWAQQAWRKATRPGPETLPPSKRVDAGKSASGGAAPSAAATPRKCVKDGRVTYTDEPCPPGSREQPVEGAVTWLPAAQK